jgi:hypothetical protein
MNSAGAFAAVIEPIDDWFGECGAEVRNNYMKENYKLKQSDPANTFS